MLHEMIKSIYQRSTYQNFKEAKLEIFNYVQVFYNNRRIHNALAYLSSCEI
ncbi:hypothetical protein IGI39_003040 [Enterococcus sp. AZ135]